MDRIAGLGKSCTPTRMAWSLCWLWGRLGWLMEDCRGAHELPPFNQFVFSPAACIIFQRIFEFVG